MEKKLESKIISGYEEYVNEQVEEYLNIGYGIVTPPYVSDSYTEKQWDSGYGGYYDKRYTTWTAILVKKRNVKSPRRKIKNKNGEIGK